VIDTSGFAFPKPGHTGKTKVIKLGKVGYDMQRRRVWAKQSRSCRHCHKGISLEQMHLHHTDGRGLGGGKRNDLKTEGLCEACHLKQHNP